MESLVDIFLGIDFQFRRRYWRRFGRDAETIKNIFNSIGKIVIDVKRLPAEVWIAGPGLDGMAKTNQLFPKC